MHKLLLTFLLACLLAACSGEGESPAAAVENYLRTRITGDEAKLVGLACRAREAEARTELPPLRR